jgi:hypothetical protein
MHLMCITFHNFVSLFVPSFCTVNIKNGITRKINLYPSFELRIVMFLENLYFVSVFLKHRSMHKLQYPRSPQCKASSSHCFQCTYCGNSSEVKGRPSSFKTRNHLNSTVQVNQQITVGLRLQTVPIRGANHIHQFNNRSTLFALATYFASG